MAGDDDQKEDMDTSRSAAPGIGSDDEQVLESLLNRDAFPDLPAELQRVRALLEAAAGPARLDELAGLGAALAAHDRMLADAESEVPRRRPIVIGIAAAVAAVLFGGVGAAYAGALPATIQDFAHRTIGAPPADERGVGNPAGPGSGDPANGQIGPAAPGNGTGSGNPGAVVPGATASPGAPGAPSTGGGTTTAPGQDGKATPPGQIKRTTKATPPGQVDNPGKATPQGQVQRTATSRPTQANGGSGSTTSPDKGKGTGSGNNQLAPSDAATQ